MSLFGNTESSSVNNTTTTSSTTTTTLANAFNNALNTTQNFSNIGGVDSGGGGATFGNFDWTLIAFGAVALIGAVILLKKKI
jgi:hypothetical protein